MLLTFPDVFVSRFLVSLHVAAVCFLSLNKRLNAAFVRITSVQSNLAKGRIADLSSRLRMDSSDFDFNLIHGSLGPMMIYEFL